MITCEDLYLRDPPKDALPGFPLFIQFYESEICRMDATIDDNPLFEIWKKATELKKTAQKLIDWTPKRKKVE